MFRLILPRLEGSATDSLRESTGSLLDMWGPSAARSEERTSSCPATLERSSTCCETTVTNDVKQPRLRLFAGLGEAGKGAVLRRKGTLLLLDWATYECRAS